MLCEYEKVKIKNTNITGVIIDKYSRDGKYFYVIEGDKYNDYAPNGGEWPLYDCAADEIILNHAKIV